MKLNVKIFLGENEICEQDISNLCIKNYVVDNIIARCNDRITEKDRHAC